jgi:Secretion system C-terminal sorting domain
MKKILLILLFLNIVNLAYSQCTETVFADFRRTATSYPGDETMIFYDFYSGEYGLIGNIAAGKQYSFRIEGGGAYSIYQKLNPADADFTLLSQSGGVVTAVNNSDFKFVGCGTIINKKVFGTCLDCTAINAVSPAPQEICNNAQQITNFLPYQATTPTTVSCYGTSKGVVINPNGTFSICGTNKDDDVWFRFTAPSSSMKIRFENISTASVNTALAIASPVLGLSWGITTSCGGPCVAGGTINTTIPIDVNEVALNVSANTTYYLQIHSAQLNNTVFSRVYLFDLTKSLPVELVKFEATKKGNTNHLTWQTATEKNNSHFDIERSTTGQDNWVKMGSVKGNGNSQIIRDYTFTDNGPLSISYYRLKQNDFDGTSEYSNVVNVANKSGKFKVNALLPNPTKDNLTIQFESNNNETVQMSVMDMTGRVVLTQNAQNTEGPNAVVLNLANLSNGMYMVSLRNNESVIVNKIVKN